jgi:DNA helicase II / ATP-dependent DNA helicase PcrA
MPSPEKRPVYSVTSLMVYETCPHQYYTTYVRKISPPVTAGMRRGASVHKLIKDLFKGPELLPPDVDPEVAGLLESFKRSRFNVSPVASEKPFRLPLDLGDVRGRIDLILPRRDGGLELVDFKSGSMRSREGLDRGLQLPVYALAAARLFDRRPEDLSYTYYFLGDGGEASFTTSAEGFAELTTRVGGVMEAIQSRQFDPTPGCECHACQWRKRWRDAARARGRDGAR